MAVCIFIKKGMSEQTVVSVPVVCATVHLLQSVRCGLCVQTRRMTTQR